MKKIETELEKIVDIKEDIKKALEEKGQVPSERFDTYANIIRENLELVSGEVDITENGNYDVSNYASANVNIEQGVFPEGEVKITTTDSVDVTMYASAKVEDANLIPENITKNVTILGITGTYEGGESDNVTQLDRFIEGNLTEIESNVTTIKRYAFYYDSNLTRVSLPQVTTIRSGTFYYCSNLKNIYVPNVETISSSAFANTTGLENISIPKLATLEERAFENCDNLIYANLPNVSVLKSVVFGNCYKLDSVCFGNVNNIWNFVFEKCYSLKCVIFQSTSRPSLSTDIFSTCCHLTGAINSTYNPNGDKDGCIYVPDDKVSSFKNGTYWSNYGDQIKGISELPTEYKELYGI